MHHLWHELCQEIVEGNHGHPQGKSTFHLHFFALNPTIQGPLSNLVADSPPLDRGHWMLHRLGILLRWGCWNNHAFCCTGFAFCCTGALFYLGCHQSTLGLGALENQTFFCAGFAFCCEVGAQSNCQ